MTIESDFDELRLDLTRQAYDDTLDIFRQGVVLFSIQKAQINQGQELFDALIASLWARTIDGASGHQLDVLGRIVGIYPRPLEDASAIIYFAPDSPDAAPDWAPVYVTGAPTAGQVPIGDPDYRTAIRVKIAKNHIKYGSPPELQYFAQIAWGVTLSVRNIGLSEVEVVFTSAVSPRVIAAILSERTDETADQMYALPVPTTTRIARAMFREPIAFAPDVAYGAPDLAPVGVAYYV